MTDQPAPADSSPRPTQPRYPRWPLLIVAGFVILIHAAWWLIGDEIVSKGNLADGDAYTRMVRIERLVDSGDWFDNTLPRAGAPIGVTIHWTRPLDVAVIALAAPLMPMLGVKRALYWGGALVSPLMHLLAALALVWAATPILGRPGALIAGALTATQFGILPFAILGRADHHAVFGLTVFLTLGFLARALIDAPSRCPFHNLNALLCGVMLAFGFWMGPETIILLGMVFGATGSINFRNY
jgi:asparagine N-glycosylation enzyme membrane subunit Stt3